VFGALLRFLPYVGPWLAAAMPVAVSLAVFRGLAEPLLAVGMFVALEVVVNNVLEPWLYGSSTGVSSFGVILAAIFWAWLWGPVGLILAMPLTVCFVVLGKHAPQLAFLSVLLGDRSSLEPHEHLYQRLLTENDLEADEAAEEYLKTSNLTSFYDDVLVPALCLAECDRHAARLSEQQEAVVLESARELVDELGDRRPDAAAPENETSAIESNANRRIDGVERRALCIPVRDEADEIGAVMLRQLLVDAGCTAEIASRSLLASELADKIDQEHWDAALLVALPPLGSRNGRYLCKRLRRRFPQLRIIVALLNGENLKKTQQRLLDCGANVAATSLAETIAAARQSVGLPIAPAGPHVKFQQASSEV
jgi:hypothetical protein